MFAAADAPGCGEEGPEMTRARPRGFERQKGSGEFDLDRKRDENKRDREDQTIHKSFLPVILNEIK